MKRDFIVKGSKKGISKTTTLNENLHEMNDDNGDWIVNLQHRKFDCQTYNVPTL